MNITRSHLSRVLHWAALCSIAAWITAPSRAEQFDVVVYGGTPGGIAAAIEAARYGRKVALVEPHAHLGGMSASGLGKSDIETPEAIGGLWQEFVTNIYNHYVKTYGADSDNVKLCRNGYFYEPSVAEGIFNQMVQKENGITVYLKNRLTSVERTGNKVVAIHVTSSDTNRTQEMRGGVFVDASYEGDLAAFAGVDFRVGREARSDFNELHAGVIYMDNRVRTVLAGSTGEGDKRVQAYTFRLCLSNEPGNRVVPTEPPPDYDRSRYTGYLEDLKAGRMAAMKPIPPNSSIYVPFYNTMGRVFTAAALPNHKFDANMYATALGYPFAAENYDYPEGDWQQREAITSRLRNITLGLLYFIQNDPEIPADQRALVRQFGLAKDEFTDNGNFPWQLYVREARRIVGEYTLSENDVIVGPGLGRPRLHADSIAAGEYPIDSMPVRKREAGHPALEGYVMMLTGYTKPYQIPYRIMVPQRVEGLIVPVAASATHIAFSSIRLEPTWMALGQAAGAAADLVLRHHTSFRRINVADLQQELLQQGQVITYFKDIDHGDPAYAAIQYFGTKGLFPDYFAKSHETVTRATARRWLELALGDKGKTLAAMIPGGEDNLTGRDLMKLSSEGGLPTTQLRKDGTESVTRGEFCSVLYSACGYSTKSGMNRATQSSAR